MLLRLVWKQYLGPLNNEIYSKFSAIAFTQFNNFSHKVSCCYKGFMLLESGTGVLFGPNTMDVIEQHVRWCHVVNVPTQLHNK